MQVPALQHKHTLRLLGQCPGANNMQMDCYRVAIGDANIKGIPNAKGHPIRKSTAEDVLPFLKVSLHKHLHQHQHLHQHAEIISS